MNLSLSTESAGDVRILDIEGEVDVYSAPALREQLTTLVDAGNADIVADLSKTSFIDSTGLGVLVAGQNHAGEAGGALRVVCAQERILKLFRITGLDAVLQIYPSRDEAIVAAGAGGS